MKMTIKINDEEFDALDIKRLHSAVLIKTDDDDGTKEVSLDWIDKEENADAEIVGYGIFVDLGDDDIYEFMFDTREALTKALDFTTKQIREQRSGR